MATYRSLGYNSFIIRSIYSGIFPYEPEEEKAILDYGDLGFNYNLTRRDLVLPGFSAFETRNMFPDGAISYQQLSNYVGQDYQGWKWIDDEGAPAGGLTETAWKSPTDWEDPATVDDWSNGDNAYTADDTYASVTNTWPEATATIYYKDLGFSIPGSSTIYGIEVNIDCYWTGTGVWPSTFSVALSWNGSSSTSKLYLLTDWPETNEGTITIGGSSELWGRTWSSSEFNDGNFEVRIFVKGPFPYLSGNATSFYLDWVRAKVYYT